MDEATKILIGTISGFAVAFLAEPVKTYFQTVFRRKNLRRMLYQEVFENFIGLQNIEGDEASAAIFKKVATSVVKIDCYNYAISNELSIYYQLREVSAFNTLYSTIQHLLEIDPSPKIRNGLIKLYSIKLSKAMASKDIDIKYLKKLKSKETVENILEHLNSKA